MSINIQAGDRIRLHDESDFGEVIGVKGNTVTAVWIDDEYDVDAALDIAEIARHDGGAPFEYIYPGAASKSLAAVKRSFRVGDYVCLKPEMRGTPGNRVMSKPRGWSWDEYMDKVFVVTQTKNMQKNVRCVTHDSQALLARLPLVALQHCGPDGSTTVSAAPATGLAADGPSSLPSDGTSAMGTPNPTHGQSGRIRNGSLVQLSPGHAINKQFDYSDTRLWVVASGCDSYPSRCFIVPLNSGEEFDGWTCHIVDIDDLTPKKARVQ